ncbi:MAG: hypothetical protein ABR584_04695 [Candidatus Baltobacteraceae bacterium]
MHFHSIGGVMNNWIISAAAQRRDELLLEASQVRLARAAMRARRSIIRGRIADGALILSSLLAQFAQAMRA